MTTNFQNKGIRYSLLVSPSARRDEIQLEDIKPDLRLWTSEQKRRRGLSAVMGTWSNRHGSGKVLGFLEEPVQKRPESIQKGRRKASIEIKAVPPEHFLESAPLD